jgi:hypothetical protein
MKKLLKLFTVLVIVVNLVVSSQAFFFLLLGALLQNEKVQCLFGSASTRTSKNSKLPDFVINVPCEWNYNWSTFDYKYDGIEDLKLVINEKNNTNVLTLIFAQVPTKCTPITSSKCKKVYTNSAPIGTNLIRVNGLDSNFLSNFGASNHNAHYHNLINTAQKNIVQSPYGLGNTKYSTTGNRTVFAVSLSDKTDIIGQTWIDNSIKSIKF